MWNETPNYSKKKRKSHSKVSELTSPGFDFALRNLYDIIRPGRSSGVWCFKIALKWPVTTSFNGL